MGPNRDPDGVWRIRDYANGRHVLRSTETRQAGFGVADAARIEGRMRIPSLWSDGAERLEFRRLTARYFTPRRVRESFSAPIKHNVDVACRLLQRGGVINLSSFAAICHRCPSQGDRQ